MTVTELRDTLNELIELGWGDMEVAMMVEGQHRAMDFYSIDTEEESIYFMTGVEPEEG